MFYCLKLRKLCLIGFVILALLSLPLALRPPALPTSAREGVALPIIMYHSIYSDKSRENDYVLSVAGFRADMEYLKAHGYTSVLPAQLYEYIQTGAPLPEKPVMISFDDGYLNNLVYALPILQELELTAIISVVGSFSQTYSENGDRDPAYAYLNWDDITALSESGVIEIGSHSYSMHALSPRQGSSRLSGESEADYAQSFKADVEKLQAQLLERCAVVPTTYAYPYGFVSAPSAAVLKELGFVAALTCEERVNYLTGDPQELFSLGRVNRPSGVSTEVFMEKLNIS